MLILPITSIYWYWHSWLQWHYFILAKDLYRTSVLPLTLSSFWNNLIILLQASDIRAFANYSWDLTVFTANGIISRSWFVPIYIFLVTSSNYIFIQTRVSPGYSCNVWVHASFKCMLCASLCGFFSFFWINKIIKREIKLKVYNRDS